jgi:hypothetical protein
MPDAITFEWHAEALLTAFGHLSQAVRIATNLAAHETAQLIAEEARRRVPRRHGRLTRAQQARPPLETLISVQPMRNDTGWVVIVQDPAAPFLPWQLEYGTQFMTKRDFFFAPARLERRNHDRRMNDALHHAIEIAERA